MFKLLAQAADRVSDKVANATQKTAEQTELTGLNKHLNIFFESLTAKVSNASIPTIPTQTELCEILSKQESSTGIACLVAGLIIIAFGGKFYKLFVSLNTVLLTACLAGILAIKMDQQSNLTTIIVAAGLVFGLLAWPLVKYAAGICCAVVGAAIGYILVESVASCSAENIANYAWIGGIVFAILLGLLGFLVLPIGVRLFLTLQGTALASSGLLNLVLKNEEYKKQLLHNFQKRPIMLPCMIGAIFFIGFTIQLVTIYTQHKKKQRESRPEPSDQKLHYRD